MRGFAPMKRLSSATATGACSAIRSSIAAWIAASRSSGAARADRCARCPAPARANRARRTRSRRSPCWRYPGRCRGRSRTQGRRQCGRPGALPGPARGVRVPLLASSVVPQRPVRTVAAVSRHPRRFPDPITAVGELIRVLGDVDPFLTIDREGRWIEACSRCRARLRAQRLDRAARAAGGRMARRQGRRHARRAARRARRRPPAWLVEHRRAADRRERGRAGRRELRPDDADRARGRPAPHRREPRRRPPRSALRPVPLAPQRGGGLPRARRHRLAVRRRRALPRRPRRLLRQGRGPEAAHQFVNDGEADLRILSIGEHREDDAVEYPTAPWVPGGREPTAG